MSDQAKDFIIAKLRDDYVAFMQKMMQMPGSPMQKQQAFLRFDEGHMWMQNAVGSYVATQAAPKSDDAANDLIVDPVDPSTGIEDQGNQAETPESPLVITPAE